MKKFHVVNGPFIKSENNTDKMMMHLFIALLPIIFFSFYKNGINLYVKGYTDILGMFYPLIFVFVGGLTTFICETLYYKFIKKQSLKESINGKYAIFPGIFLSLVLPLSTPISILIVGAVLATVIGKLIYGGFGNNIFNPALIGCLFVMALYSSNIGGYLNAYEIDTISSATPLTNASMAEAVTYSNYVLPYGNLWNFFFGMIPGSVGETCSALIIVAFIYLVITKVIKPIIPIMFVGTVFVLTLLIGEMNGLGTWYPLFEILSGGLLFGAVFMATDPVTSPVTKLGQVLYGVSLGFLTVIFRMITSAPEGVMTSILTMNMFVMIIDKIGSRNKEPKQKWIWYLILIGVLLSLSLGLQGLLKNESGDANFELVNLTEEDGKNTYLVNQKGNGGNIQIEIVIEKGKVTKYNVLSHNETPAYYSKVEAANYIQTLIKNSNKLEDVDTVSGATISSSALKKALENVLKLEGV